MFNFFNILKDTGTILLRKTSCKNSSNFPDLVLQRSYGPRCCRHQHCAFNVSDTLEHVAVVLETAVKSMPSSVQQADPHWVSSSRLWHVDFWFEAEIKEWTCQANIIETWFFEQSGKKNSNKLDDFYRSRFNSFNWGQFWQVQVSQMSFHQLLHFNLGWFFSRARWMWWWTAIASNWDITWIRAWWSALPNCCDNPIEIDYAWWGPIENDETGDGSV